MMIMKDKPQTDSIKAESPCQFHHVLTVDQEARNLPKH